MVAWASDGTMAGYDPLTKKLKIDLFHFATPGTVDLNGLTRFNFILGAGISPTVYPNSLMTKTRMTFTAADYAANNAQTNAANKQKMCMSMMLVRADKFPEGHIPTPQEVYDAPFDWAQRSSTYSWGTATSTYDYNFDTSAMDDGGWYWDTKWWVLLYPSRTFNVNTQWSRANDPPMAGPALNSIGRVISFWSDRSPQQPVITSPVSGSTHLAGSEFTLSMNGNDPDETTPTDVNQYNADIAGVHYQYRTVPTVDNPDPAWQDLPFDYEATYDFGPIQVRGGAWDIRGARYWNGRTPDPAHKALIDNVGCSVVAGAGDTTDDYQPGKGALPTGEWQIRGRVFDFGHPYPGPMNVDNQPGILGVNPATNWIIEPAKDNYPSQNTSPWSEPVRISIPTQVPPPIGLSPANDLAVSGNIGSVRLRWNYRNTHLPSRAQLSRVVQIRKVGDLEWSTVFDGLGSDPYVDLPMVLEQDDIPAMQLLADGGFEGGTTDGWIPTPGDPSTVSNVNNGAQAHSGSRYLKIHAPAGNVFGTSYKMVTAPPADYLKVTIDGWVWMPPGEQGFFFTQLYSMDADGNVIGESEFTDNLNYPYIAAFQSKAVNPGDPDPGGWFKISDCVPYNSDVDRLTVYRHPDAVSMLVVLYTASNIGDPSDWRTDDMSLLAEGTGLDSFTMEPTNHYEWRVKVTDADDITSGYSTPVRFWMVPGAATGDVRPIPSATIEGATLGCGKHRVEVFRRGGTQRVGELTSLSHVDWGRVRDDISTAQVVVSGWDVDCGELLKDLQTNAYEIVIHRDNGYSNERVWEGPITKLTYEWDKVTIDAKDVMHYVYRRIIRQQMSDSGKGNGTTVVDRAMRVVQNCLAPDDPNVLAYLQVLTSANDAMQYRSIPAYSRTGYEEVDDMAANAGLDYTAVGRAILLWGTKNRIGTLPEFRDKNLGASPIVSEYGMQFANRYAVSDGNGVYGVAERLTNGEDPIYGLVEVLSSTWASDSEDDSGTYTQAGRETVIKSFEGYAERSIADKYPPPVVVRVPDSTTLNPNTPISIQHLVPGVVIPLRSVGTLRTVADTQKLDVVKVTEDKGKETIAVTMSPFSTDDAVAGGGEEE